MGRRSQHRQDRNHQELRAAAERMGWLFEDTSQTGLGYDAILTKAGRTVRVEIKDGALAPSQRTLTPHEIEVHARLKAHGVTVEILTGVEDLCVLERPMPGRRIG